MNQENSKYDEEYYSSYCDGERRSEYVEGGSYTVFFNHVAETIKNELRPINVLDAGCAKGFLVEALRDREINAYGIDISEYALSQVREDIKPFCKNISITEPLEQRYDLIVCIEVLEHLEMRDIKRAIANFCEHSDTILFSSTPFVYKEETHINVKPIEFWCEQFAYQGFYHDVEYDATYISVQSMCFRRGNIDSISRIRQYERALFEKTNESFELRLENTNLNLNFNQQKKENAMDKKEKEIIQSEKEMLQNQCNELRQEIIKMCKTHDEKINALQNEKERIYNDLITRFEQVAIYESRYKYSCVEIGEYQEEIHKYVNEIEELKREINAIHETVSWKFTRPLRWFRRITRKK